MPTYYFDAVNGNNANPGTEAQPKRLVDEFGNGATGDVYYIKRGTVQLVTRTTGNPYLFFPIGARVMAYGDGPNPIWRATGPARDLGGMIILATNRRDMVIMDQDFDGERVLTHSLYAAAQPGNTQAQVPQSNTFIRCRFYGFTGSGMQATIEEPSNATRFGPFGFTFDSCDFFDNAVHGLLLMGPNHRVVNCRAWNNGWNSPTGAHGFSTRYARLTPPSWTLDTTPGLTNVYFVTVGSDIAAGMSKLAGPRWVGFEVSVPYARNVNTTPSSLTDEQYLLNGTTLYVKLPSGVTPNNGNITYAWGDTENILFVGCEAWGTIWDLTTAFTEGHGFVADDYAGTHKFVNCYAHDNEGTGFNFNRGDGNMAIGCVAVRNGVGGLGCNLSRDSKIRNCTFLDNGLTTRPGGAQVGEILFNGPSTTGSEVRNCVLLGSLSRGISFWPGAANCNSINNNINGYGTAVFNGTATGTVTTNTRANLYPDGSLKPPGTSNPLALAGSYLSGITLRNGRLRPGVVPIGAYMPTLPRTPRL